MNNEYKMFINDEEVISNKEFTIKEEMLTASSTILNNCYPKSWEDNKDYVNNFYFPKDYSKFLLARGNFSNGNEEYSVLNVSGANPEFETNVDKELNNINIYGKTTQTTSPGIRGKNMLCLGNINSSAYGITITKLDNSTFKINGTVTGGDHNFSLGFIDPPTLSNLSYVFSTHIVGGRTASFGINIPQSNNFRNMTIGATQVSFSKKSTTENGRTFNGLVLSVTNGTVFNNAIVEIQLEQNTNATQFEPYFYVPPKPSIDNPSALKSVGKYNNDTGKYEIEVTNTGDNNSNTQVYILNNPLRSVNTTKDKLYFENGVLCVERNIGYIESYNGETIDNSYMSTTGGLDNGASVQYILDTPIIETLTGVIPMTYNGDNQITLDTGSITTTIDIYYYWKNFDILFAGVVKNSGNISLRPTEPKYCSLQILDYKTFLSESDTLDFVISNKTIAQAINMVVDAISGYGFILGNINISQANDIIGAYSTLNKTAYDVFQYLANISGSRWRARFIDKDTMAIDFYDPESLPRGIDIEYNQLFWEQNNIVDLKFNYSTRDYRNKQIILSNEVYGGIDYTELLLSNGYSTSYITQNNIASVKSITVNGVEAEVITQSEKELGIDADFYYTPGKNVIESADSYTAGTQIKVIYTPLVKGRQIVYNNEEVTRIATQTNTLGVISRYENRNDILSSDELENIAETYIKYKGKPEIILTLTTLNEDLYNIGEITYFDAPILDLAQDYMVKSKSINFILVGSELNLFYTYELTSSFNSEKAINYFDNQRNKSQGNIAEGESITRNIDINNAATIIWENATITETTITIDGDNTLNSPLNSPFIN